MKRFQFSISAVLALTFIVAIVLSLRGGLASESSLQSIWIASFVFSYWRSSKPGWRQVVRATATTAVVWAVMIVCLYAWFLNRVGAPSAVELALHGVVVVVAGGVLGFAAACLVEGSRAVVRFWLRAPWSRRVRLALPLLALISLVAVAWTTARRSYWEPASVTSGAEAFEEGFPCLPAIRQRPELEYVHLVVASADGEFVAAILKGQQKMLVFELVSGELAASFAAAGDEWFSDLTFHPDGSALAGLLRSKTAGPTLVQWDAPSWRPREPTPLDDLLDRSQRGERTSLSLDRCLLVVRSRAVDQRTANVQIFTVDLLEERLARRAFASATIELEKLPPSAGLSTFFDPSGWIVAPSGKWIATSGYRISAARDYLFRANAAPTRLRGRAIGFFRDTDCLAVHERSMGFYWKREKPEYVAPPFWDYLRIDRRSRVTIYDCRRQEVIARSRWFPDLSSARMTPDRSQLLAEQRKSVLIWEFPEAPPDRVTRLDRRS